MEWGFHTIQHYQMPHEKAAEKQQMASQKPSHPNHGNNLG